MLELLEHLVEGQFGHLTWKESSVWTGSEFTEDDEDNTDGCSVPGMNHFEKGVCVGGLSFEFDCQSCEQDDSDRCTLIQPSALHSFKCLPCL